MAETRGPESGRRLGPREAAVMQILWQRPAEHVTVREVRDALDADLAYTTVMTLLSRLHRKGLLERKLAGRAWAYRPTITQGQHAAEAMRTVLRGSTDHAEVLFHFVEELTLEEQRELRRRLRGGG